MPTNMPSNFSKIRQDFSMLRVDAQGRSLAYLDSAASSLTPEPVIAAVDAYYRSYRANVHRGLYKASEKATEEYERARKDVATFIGATPEETIFTSGTTASLNMLARMLEQELGAGDEVVLTVMEHHANMVPWQEMAKRRGFVLRFVPVTAEGRLDMDAFAFALNAKTKVVAFTWVSNVTGVVNLIADIVKLVRAKSSAQIVVDAAQAMLHMQVDVRRLDVDYLVFSAHKMFGPTGVGVLYGKRAHLDRLQPVVFGGDMIHEVALEGSTWAEAPRKFEAGTSNISGVIGLGAAVRYLESFDREEMRSHEFAMTEYALAQLRSVEGVRVIGPQHAQDRIGVISFVVEGIHSHDLAAVLDTKGVCIRAGYHCAMPLMSAVSCPTGTARMSIAPYTTKQDIDVLIEGIRHAQSILIARAEKK
jgi:cysteine desulfurase/selenocysteine lyase